jgi:hypothetical protein
MHPITLDANRDSVAAELEHPTRTIQRGSSERHFT